MDTLINTSIPAQSVLVAQYTNDVHDYAAKIQSLTDLKATLDEAGALFVDSSNDSDDGSVA